jgi:mRNA interferase MazF
MNPVPKTLDAPGPRRRGDIVLVLFPDSNLRTSKRRPALVIQADRLGLGLPQTIAAMITSNTARAGRISRVLVRVADGSGRESGLLMDSVIMTDNLPFMTMKSTASSGHFRISPKSMPPCAMTLAY